VVAAQKIKKKTADLTLELEPTADILKELGSHKNGKVLVGFAAETENHVKNGLEKLKAKNLDLIIINPASGPDSAFDSDMNHATIIDASGHTEEIPLVSKRVMADRILDRVVQLLK
jgi:phosphopantothenoylcysteine decarboxylase/phosphopantothenate--cysteine ligase